MKAFWNKIPQNLQYDWNLNEQQANNKQWLGVSSTASEFERLSRRKNEMKNVVLWGTSFYFWKRKYLWCIVIWKCSIFTKYTTNMFLKNLYKFFSVGYNYVNILCSYIWFAFQQFSKVNKSNINKNIVVIKFVKKTLIALINFAILQKKIKNEWCKHRPRSNHCRI